MLTSLQSAQSTAAISAMQSIVETIEDRRREEAEKASGRKNDDIREQAHLQSDDTARQANARINEHFFGNSIQDGDTLAKLISRFSDALGITQQEGETTRNFRQLGIGYANLGALLMAMGKGYDTEAGRSTAAAITSIMTGASYRRSAELAAVVGTYNGYAVNAEAQQRATAPAISAGP